MSRARSEPTTDEQSENESEDSEIEQRLDELEQQVESLAEENADLKQQLRAKDARIDALNTKLNAQKELLIGEREMTEHEVESHESLVSCVDRLDDDVEAAEDAATTAVRMAKHAKNSGTGEKIDAARQIARDHLVKEAARTRTSTSVTVGTVQEKADPQHDLAYQTVKDAFGDLKRNWGALNETTNESGTRVLAINPDAVGRDLAKTTERSVGQDGLAKRLISSRKGEGA